MWMKRQRLVMSRMLTKWRSRTGELERLLETRKRIRSRMRVGLFADEVARLLPIKNPLELLQTKGVNDRQFFKIEAALEVVSPLASDLIQSIKSKKARPP